MEVVKLGVVEAVLAFARNLPFERCAFDAKNGWMRFGGYYEPWTWAVAGWGRPRG